MSKLDKITENLPLNEQVTNKKKLELDSLEFQRILSYEIRLTKKIFERDVKDRINEAQRHERNYTGEEMEEDLIEQANFMANQILTYFSFDTPDEEFKSHMLGILQNERNFSE